MPNRERCARQGGWSSNLSPDRRGSGTLLILCDRAQLTGRWLLSAHPLPPLLILPPLSLSLTLSSSLFAFLVISFVFRSKSPRDAKGKAVTHNPMSEEAMLEEKRKRAFEARDAEEKREGARRQREWEEVEASALGGLQKMPEERKRGSTLLGGVG